MHYKFVYNSVKTSIDIHEILVYNINKLRESKAPIKKRG